jgi:hypothetical protein
MMTSGEDLGTALTGLERASRHRLAEHWAEYFGAPPPPRTSRSLMIRAVAYKMQQRALGGLSAATRRLLSGQGPAAVRRRRTLSPGTVLIREWHGIGHQVTILEKGVLYRGLRYRSMSEVARLVTGARWSGPRFFGVKA